MFFNSHLRRFPAKIIFCLLILLLSACSSKSKISHTTRSKRRDGVYHTVRRGQTLWRIAKTYRVRVEDITRSNGISDPNKIRAGQRLFIPKTTGKYKAKAKSGRTRKSKKVVHKKFSWPVKGKLVSGYGNKSGKKNDGVDIAALAGTDIRAAGSGRVIYAGDKMQYYGNMVIIKHPDQYFTVYAHNSVNLVKVSQWVTGGQVIARVGDTGRVESPRLHFEIRYGEKPVNPQIYLQ